MMVNQLDIVVADKQKKAVMIDAAIPNNSNSRKKEHKKPEKYQRPGEGW